ncbi:MAG: PEGA domain-containing protein, partial [Myxococcales bacterium]|nr:PEGA domain-containing protein [Myxococcales bacterium]
MILLVIALLSPPVCPPPPVRSSFSSDVLFDAAVKDAAWCRCRDFEPDAQGGDPSAELDGPQQLRCAYWLHDEGRFADAVVVYDRWFARREAPPPMLEIAAPFRARAARCVPRDEDAPGDRCAPAAASCEDRQAAASDAAAWGVVGDCFAARGADGDAAAFLPAARAFDRAGRPADALAAYRHHLSAGPDAAVEAELDAKHPARLMVNCTPAGALVGVGEQHGQCPVFEVALPDGEYTVTVHAPGHRKGSHPVRLAHDERQSIALNLKPEAREGRWMPWVAAGVGAAATGVGVAFHVRNSQSFADLKEKPGRQDLRDDVDLSFDLAVGGYALGALCTSLAAWLWLDDE